MSIQHFAAAPGQIISFLLSSCIKSLVERSTLLIQRSCGALLPSAERENERGRRERDEYAQHMHSAELIHRSLTELSSVLIYDCHQFPLCGYFYARHQTEVAVLYLMWWNVSLSSVGDSPFPAGIHKLALSRGSSVVYNNADLWRTNHEVQKNMPTSNRLNVRHFKL